ncbi:MAG: prephenate dehydrogenase/arogenate dehydrogenase family protein [Planctomycetia bacterium]|nr:prephenate dehydrogenase/arogenate dehydrogenase family protein [Planctomycetia bacterium]
MKENTKSPQTAKARPKAPAKSPRGTASHDAPYDTVAIVGAGLIGGSIGLALRERGLARHVIGIGRRAESLKLALDRGAVSRVTQNLAEGVADAQLIVVCTPVESIVEHVTAAAAACRAGALITDAGSTKRQIVNALSGRMPRGVRFVGGHPLAGGEQSGPLAARADLLIGKTVVLTPTSANTSADRRDAATFWLALGANVIEMSAAAHDRAVATTSHLPHLVAAAMAAATPQKLLPLAAGGWQDTTRVAAGDVDLWMQILRTNRADVLKSLGEFGKVVASFDSALRKNDDKKLAQLLRQAKRIRDAVGN